jgi:hypothetical protein
MITKPKVQKIRVRKWLEAVRGGMVTTNTLDNFDEPIVEEILGGAALLEGEEALLANYRGSSGWCLLTTKRLIWSAQGSLSSLLWGDIALGWQPPEKSAQIVRGELSKNDISDLEVFDASGRRHVIQVEPGEPYYMIWSAILAFSSNSKKPDPIPL